MRLAIVGKEEDEVLTLVGSAEAGMYRNNRKLRHRITPS